MGNDRVGRLRLQSKATAAPLKGVSYRRIGVQDGGIGTGLLASGGSFLQGVCRRGISWVEGFERKLRQRGGAEEGKGAGVGMKLKRNDDPVALLIERRWRGSDGPSGW